MSSTRINQHCYLFIFYIPFDLESLRGSNSIHCMTWYSGSNIFMSIFLSPLLYLLSKLKNIPFSLLSSFSWGVNLVGWGGLEEGTSLSLEVLGVVLLVAITKFLLSTFLASMTTIYMEVGAKRHTSCWMLSFKVPIKRSNNLSSSIPSTLRLSFWNCWMCLITRPFFLRFTNWVEKELLLTSSWYDINYLVKTN